MRSSESYRAIASSTLQQASRLFAAHQQTIYQSTDRMFAMLMLIQWIAGIVAALWIAPRTWIGAVSQTHIHVWAAIFLGGAISLFPMVLAVLRPGASTTRYVIATAQMMMSALLIHLTGGRIETHFHVFGSLAFLAFYRDWRVLVPATIVVAADHFLRGIFWPQSVYGVLSASEWRWLEHAGWVLFEDTFLIIAIKRSVGEMWGIAQRTAALNDNEERYRAVVEQTAEGLLLSDVDNLRVIECNQAFANMLGYTLAEALTLTAYDFVVDDPKSIEYRAASFRKGELPPSGERHFLCKDGRIVDVEVNVTVISYGGKDVFCTIVRDIGERKRAEEALRESELRFRSVTHSANDAIVSADSEGNIVFWNKGAEKSFGFTEEEILGQPLTKLMPEQYRAPHAEGMKRFLATGEARVIGKTVELSGLRKDGTIFPFDLSLATWRTMQGTFFTGIFRDITERKQTEEALRKAHDELETRVRERTAELAAANDGLQSEVAERKTVEDALRDSEKRYRLLFESNPLPLWVYDLEKLSFLAVNNAAVHNYGYSREEFLAMTVSDIRPPEDVPDFLNTVAKLVEGADNTGKWRHRKKDGSIIDVEITSHTLDFAGRTARIVLAVDITERKRSEKALQESQQWLTAIFDSSRDGIIVEENERIVYVNQSFAHLFGYEPDELVGQPIWLVSEQESSRRMLEYSRKRLMGEEVPSLYEFQGTRKDKTKVDLEASVSTARIADKTYIISLARNVTERKRMEQERQVMFEIIQGVIATANLDDLFTLVHHSISKVLYAENCFVALHDPQTDFISFEFWVDKFDPVPPPRPVGIGFSSYVFRTGKPLLLTEKLTAQMIERGEVKHSGSSSPSWLGVPLRISSRTIGVLAVQHYEDKDAYTDRDLQFLESAGSQIALAVERKRSEEALKDSQQWIATIVESSRDGIMVEEDETIVYANTSYTRLFGYDNPGDLVGQDVSLVSQRETTQPMREYGRKRMRGEEAPSLYEFRGTRRDGTSVDLEASVSTATIAGKKCIITLTRDIAERKTAESKIEHATEELDRQRAFLRQVIDLNPSFIFAKDREGRFVLVNQALAEAFGTTVEGLLGKSDADLNPNKEEVEWFRRDDLEVMDTGTEKFVPEGVFTDSSGKVRWLQTIKRPIISQDGTAKQILGVATDITERKKAEQALRDSEAQLRQAQKMESIGTLAGGIAHDFNNLMTAVTGYSELTLRTLDTNHPLRPRIEEIKKAGERATSLTRQLLAFSRKQMMQPRVLDLNTVISGLARMLTRMIGEDIDLRIEPCDSLGQVKADPGQLEQVLLNLAVNARDAMPDGGCLTIKTENVHMDEKLANRRFVAEAGHYVMLAVSDSGCGMDAETQIHIFEPFFTTKEIGKGTGLGLSTVYGIVKQSGGSIWVYSEVGRGTTFKIYLPRVDEVIETEESNAGCHSAPRGNETILLVEDEEMVRDLSKEILEEYGYAVIAAPNGKEGLRVCKEFAGHIDLVITDVVMPQMGGRELAENVSALRPNTRVLFMSGFTDDAIVRHGVLDDGVFFIQKPFSPDSLALKAREVLDYRV